MTFKEFVRRLAAAVSIAVAGSGAMAPAMGADVASKPLPVPSPVAALSGFYLGGLVGGSATATESEIAVPGVVVGTLKQWPAGAYIGAFAGYSLSAGGFALSAELEASGNFLHGSVGCFPGAPCLGQMHNSVFLAEKLWIGLPSVIWSGLTVSVGPQLVQRSVSLSVLDVGTRQYLNGTQWLMGPAAAGMIEYAMPAARSHIGVEYMHAFYNRSFTPLQSVPVFTNTTKVSGEDRVVLRWRYDL